MDLTSYIASMSMNISQASLTGEASMKMLKNTMDSSEAAAVQIMDMLPPAPGPNESGGLLDVRV